MMKTAIVIPNHLPHLDFLAEWDELRETQLHVVQDSSDDPSWADSQQRGWVYRREGIVRDLGENAWIIPQQTSACRSYGFYKAWQSGAEVILTLDSDCYPERPDYWLRGHLANLFKPRTLGWVSSNPDEIPTRGFPYEIRSTAETMLSHGLWSEVPDHDAVTMLTNPTEHWPWAERATTIPQHNFFPMCAMNLAFKRELAPAMYFGLFGPAYGFDRFDDIWAGILVKRILDHLGYAAVSGAPSVEHRRQSDPFQNLRKEAPGMEANEHFWKAVLAVPVTATTVSGCYRELIEGLPDGLPGLPATAVTAEWKKPSGFSWMDCFKTAALIWLDLFE